MTKRKQKEPEAAPPEDVTHEQIEALLPVLTPLLMNAMSVKSYMRDYDRQMRERAVVALERIATALEKRR